METILVDWCVLALCKLGGETTATRISVTMGYGDLMQIIHRRWPKLKLGFVSTSYQLPGHNTCILDSEEDFSIMMELVRLMQLQHVVINVKDAGEQASIVNDDCHVDTSFIEYENDKRVGICMAPYRRKNNEKNLLTSTWTNELQEIGQVFEGGAEAFRSALSKYAIQTGFKYKFVKNDKERVTAVCSLRHETGCPWRVHASKEKTNDFFYLRTMSSSHSCGSVVRTSSHPRVSSNLVGELFCEKIRNQPLTRPIDVMLDLKNDYGLDIEYHRAWKGIENAKAEIYGDHKLSFEKLRWYFHEAKKMNPGSHFHLEVNSEDHRFERSFVAFGACLHGFKFIRPVIYLDGTFLKGRYKGVLLGATSKDGNEGVFSLAYAVVSSEDTENWTWFLKELRSCLDPDRTITFISDRNDGLIEGVNTVFPEHFHAYCMFHLKLNLRSVFKGVKGKFRSRMVFKFGQCAIAATPEKFEMELEALIREGGKPMKDFIKRLPKDRWANAYFRGHRYGELYSNVAESWNAKIVEARNLPVTNMIDMIRYETMQDIATKSIECKKWTGQLCPKQQKKLQSALDMGSTWTVVSAGNDIFEVTSDPSVFVDIRERTCSCGGWQYNGFPCDHAAVVLHYSSRLTHREIVDYIEPYFHVRFFDQSYSKFIHPIPTVEIGESSDSDCFILPPLGKRLTGRPRKKRIPSRGEKVREMKCGRCGKLGHHNKKSCKEIINN